MRVLLVEGPLLPLQMAQWSSVAAHGVDLHVAGTLTPPQQSWWNTGPPNGVESHIFEPKGWVQRNALWWVYPGLRELIGNLRPDIIHVASEPWSLFYSQVRRTKAKLIGHGADNLWVHGGVLERRIRAVRVGRILKRLDAYVSWNTAGLEHARRFGLAATKPTLVAPSRAMDPTPYGQAAQDREVHRKRFGIDGQVNVGFVGRLVPEKGVGWLIDALAMSAAPAQLVLVGAGPYREAFEMDADSAGVRTHFVGSLSPQDMSGVMAALDVLVVPSLSRPDWVEQFGRVVLEAMFAGTPVVSSDSGALPEVVGEGGIIVAEGDVPGLSKAVGRLVADEKGRRELGRKGYEWAISRYSPDTLAESLIAFWTQVLGN